MLEYGFFNSIGGDRTYDAEDFTNYLSGIITDGCFPNDTGFKVRPNPAPIGGGPPSVIIAAGKAYLNGMWVINPEDFIYYLGTEQQITPNMVHLVYFCFDTTDAGRKVTIECLTDAAPMGLPDGAGKYYMPIARINDLMNTNPGVEQIFDLRLYAGVSGVGITTPSLVDRCVTGAKVALKTLTDGLFADGTILNRSIHDGIIDLAKCASGEYYIPRVADAITLSPVGIRVYGPASAVYNNSVAAAAMLTAGLYDSEAAASGTVVLGIQYKKGTGAWTDVPEKLVTDSVYTELGCQFQYPVLMDANTNYQFRVVAYTYGTAQFSTTAYLFGHMVRI